MQQREILGERIDFGEITTKMSKAVASACLKLACYHQRSIFRFDLGDNLLTSVSVARQCGIIGEVDVVVQVTPVQCIPRGATPPNLLNFSLLGSSSECTDLEKFDRFCERLRALAQSSTPEAVEASILISRDQAEGILLCEFVNVHLVMTGTTWNYIRVKLPNFLPVVGSLVLLKSVNF